MMRFNWLLCFVFCYSLSIAQIEATTKDGKKVILNKNGTWKYAKSAQVAETPKSGTTDLKKEALGFTTQLVQSYFTKDCSFFVQSLSSEVFLFSGALSVTEDMKSKLCESVKGAVTDNTKTFADYSANYKMELLSKDELEAKVKSKLPSHFNSSDEEFYFVGLEQKPDSKISSFISVRLFALLLRKTAGKWEVKGFLND